MAQLNREGRGDFQHLLEVLRQRKALLVAVLVVAMMFCACVVLGVSLAWRGNDVQVYRDESSMGSHDERADDYPVTTSPENPHAQAQSPETQTVIVDVAGAVKNPGVYTLSSGARINDALKAAGGVSEQADVSAINRAAPLMDGQQIYVPTQGEEAPPSAAEGASGTGESSSVTGGLVNINTASVEELDVLPGVGPSTAQAIVEDREQNGAFSRIEDLMRVSGIGEKKFEQLRDAICV